MKKYIVLSLTLVFLAFCFSCKNKKSENKKTINSEQKNELKYNADSASQATAVLVFGNDGKVEYVEGNPENVFQKTKSGLEYRIVAKSKSNSKPKFGDIVYIDMSYQTENDSVLFNSKNVEKNFKMRVAMPSHKGGCIEEAFMMLSEGDSAIFKIDAFNFFTYTQNKVNIPNFIKKGDKLIFKIKLKKIVSDNEYVKQNKEMFTYYISQENSLIERFLLNYNYPTVKLESGLRIMTIKKGNGKKPSKSKTVSIHYTASFIDGGVFDSSIERNEVFKFVIGKNQVIPGLEEGVLQMNIGDHAILVIPFRLAYGEEKYGIIPPFSTLVFEIELLDAK